MDLKIIILILFLIVNSKQKRLINNQKKIVNLGFSINNSMFKFLYVSLYSTLENSHSNTIYNIYIQIKNNFQKCYKKLLYNLEKIYFNCNIFFINMKREFINAFRNHLDISTYYRLKLPLLCPKINRIIFIDADTLILKDLLEIYTLNFEKNYILGRLDMITNELDPLGINTTTYINAGVLLLDLYSLRKYNYDEKFMNYIKNNNNYRNLWHHAQTTINYICYDKIGLLRPKYHMWAFISKQHVIYINNRFRKKYNEEEFLSDFNTPFIVHFPGSFKKNMNIKTKYHKKYNEYLFRLKENNLINLNDLKYIINYFNIGIFIFVKIILRLIYLIKKLTKTKL